MKRLEIISLYTSGHCEHQVRQASQAKEGEYIRTDFGVYMADLLKQFGLVDYNCWLLIDNQ